MNLISNIKSDSLGNPYLYPKEIILIFVFIVDKLEKKPVFDFLIIYYSTLTYLYSSHLYLVSV